MTPLPPVIFGSSALGNLYRAIPEDAKREIVRGWMNAFEMPLIDSAGKYGAGLALETIGRLLKELDVDPARVSISNKLGWKRVQLRTPEPTFEPGAWVDLKYDAEFSMGYDGILECYHQGNELLGDYRADLVSLHDPDEYLAGAANSNEETTRYREILDSYQALVELREQGRVTAVGVGSKDPQVIDRLHRSGVVLDWAMFANSYTIYSHPVWVLDLMERLSRSGVAVINSAVFHGGFLIGGDFFDYRSVARTENPELFAWRDEFLAACTEHSVSPAHACCQYGRSPKPVGSIALNTSRPERIPDNVRYGTEDLPEKFWQDLKARRLI